jgi:hypothetical protein
LACVLAGLASSLAVPSIAGAGDRDGDGLSNRFERKRSHTDPGRADTDRDRLRDGAELRRFRTNPRSRDTDHDGVSDRRELRRGTNPRRKPRRRKRRPGTPPRSAPWPDASNTGVAGCGALKPRSGLTVTKDGAVVENIDSSGPIVVLANNVTLRCVRVRAATFYAVRLDDATNTTLERVEIDCRSYADNNAGMIGDSYIARRIDVHHCADGAKVGRNVLIESSYCHDLDTVSSDPHYDCLQLMGCECYVQSDVTIRHNTLWPRRTDATSAILIKTDFGPISGVSVENNRMNFGAWTVYSVDGNAPGFDPPTNVSFTGNRFGRGYTFGLRSFEGSVRWTDNVRDDTGAPIP